MLPFPPGVWVTAGTWEFHETKAALEGLEMVWDSPTQLAPRPAARSPLQQFHPCTCPRASAAAQPSP